MQRKYPDSKCYIVQNMQQHPINRRTEPLLLTNTTSCIPHVFLSTKRKISITRTTGLCLAAVLFSDFHLARKELSHKQNRLYYPVIWGIWQKRLFLDPYSSTSNFRRSLGPWGCQIASLRFICLGSPVFHGPKLALKKSPTSQECQAMNQFLVTWDDGRHPCHQQMKKVKLKKTMGNIVDLNHLAFQFQEPPREITQKKTEN